MIELVWDDERVGTATGTAGVSLSVGERAHFSPDELLASAAASCIMRTFLRMAGEAGVEVLSYASTASAAPACETDASPSVVVHSYIVAANEQARNDLATVAARSREASPIAKLLGDRLTFTANVRTIEAKSDGAS